MFKKGSKIFFLKIFGHTKLSTKKDSPETKSETAKPSGMLP
jgi:hypothetical protein